MPAEDDPGTALVTGASSGIGRELARVLAEHGHDVVLVARNERKLKELARELREVHGVDARPMPTDLAAPDAARDLARRLDAEGIRVEVLVNNAGIGVHG